MNQHRTPRRRRLLLGLALLVPLATTVLAAAGCSKDPYTASMAASLDVSNGVNDGLTVITTLETDKLITGAEVTKVAGYLNNLTVLNRKFRAHVRAVHTANPAATKAAYI